MPKVDVYGLTGQKSGQIVLPSDIFAAQIRQPLMTQAVRVYLSNQRKAKAKAKTRAEVSGSGKKIWRQKGTGRARHGDRYAPIFVGGGVAHGPTGKENYKLKMPKKMARQALSAALTSKFRDGELIIVSGLTKIEPKTAKMVKILAKLKINLSKTGKILLILPKIFKNVVLAARNIKGVRLILVGNLNTYEVLNGGKLIFMKEAIEKLREQ